MMSPFQILAHAAKRHRKKNCLRGFAKGKQKGRGGQDLKEEHPFFGAPIPQAQVGADEDLSDGERGCVSIFSHGPLPTFCPCEAAIAHIPTCGKSKSPGRFSLGCIS